MTVVKHVPWDVSRLSRSVLVQEDVKVLLDQPFEVNQLPDSAPCDIEFAGAKFLRLIKCPDVNRLIIWDPRDNKKTYSNLLGDINNSDVRESIVNAIEYFNNV